MPESDPLRELLCAATVGQFNILGELGRGGMGAVYQAIEVSLGRKVAIKVLPPEFAFDDDVTERFRREARTVASLDHPYIVPVYRVSEGGNLLWYAMKYVEGQSLNDRIERDGSLSVTEAVGILFEVAEALDFAHERGIIHRDMKPHNVMLDRRGHALVTDFGIAKTIGAGTLTRGGLIGTPAYMAPEQWYGKALTGATDLYAVAVMTCQMLSGRPPFDAPSYPEMMQLHVSMEPPLDDVLASLPRGARAVIRQGMAKSPVERQPTVVAFALALHKALSAAPAPPAAPAHETPPPEQAREVTPWEAAQARAAARRGVEAPAAVDNLSPWQRARALGPSGREPKVRLRPWQAWAVAAALVVLAIVVALATSHR